MLNEQCIRRCGIIAIAISMYNERTAASAALTFCTIFIYKLLRSSHFYRCCFVVSITYVHMYSNYLMILSKCEFIQKIQMETTTSPAQHYLYWAIHILYVLVYKIIIWRKTAIWKAAWQTLVSVFGLRVCSIYVYTHYTDNTYLHSFAVWNAQKLFLHTILKRCV